MFTDLIKYSPIIPFIRSNYFSKGPSFVDIEVSNRCNLSCAKCWYHGENGIGDRYLDSEMTTVEILELIDQLALYKPHVYFGGGEPFIREDFLTIMAHAKCFALPIALTTNGTLLDQKKIEIITELGIDEINFSIDGIEKSHDRLRGEGSFSKVITSIQYLLECKKKRRLSRPSITVNLTINPFIINQLKITIDAIREATGDEVDCYRIHHLWFITPGELQTHQEEVYKALKVPITGARAHCIPLSLPPDSAMLAGEISQIRGMKKITSFPDLQDGEIQDFYSEDYRLDRRCQAPFHSVVVKPNGDVKFCPDEWIDGYVLGNVRNESIEAIWKNKRAKRFRSVIFRKKFFPACKRCSWLYCF